MPPLTTDWIHLAALVGALQGVFLAGVLAAHRTNRTANRLLALLMAAFTVFLLQSVYYSAGLVRVWPHLFGISYSLPWVFGPLVYLYASCASDRERRLRSSDLWHFAAVGLIALVGIPIYTMSGADKIALFDQLQAGNPPPLFKALAPTMYASGLSYSVATVMLIRRHHARVKLSYSSIERVHLRWLLWIAGAAVGVWVMATALSVAAVVRSTSLGSGDDAVALAIALLVYAIGYRGLRQPEIFRYELVETPLTPLVAPSIAPPETPSETPVDTAVAPPVAPPAPTRYEHSGLSEREARALKDTLLDVMARDHPYRDPDLTLAGLAEQLDTTPHRLSEVLNGQLEVSFYDFVNGYRVDEVRRRLADAKSKNRKMLGLAMDAGFASKSTFNQVFKNRTGQTPSTYRKALAS